MAPTARLLSWYEANRRDLPWRGDRSPYEIWVSEIMLQQTRSETVERYYERFLDRFPTLSDLASASVEEVLAMWSGLGYYRRARSLHGAALELEAVGGELPSSVEELRRLPGIGAYTAAAIASLAFGAPEPVLDGNVERVLARYRAVDEPPRRAAGKRRLLEIARELLDPARPGDFNQALMELGARVCTPRRPACPACPLSPDCLALEKEDPSSYPVSNGRSVVVKEELLVIVVRSGEELLMRRRPVDASLLPGMWELPWVEAEASTGPAAGLAGRYGGVWTVGPPMGRVRHSITTRLLQVRVHAGSWSPSTVAESGSLRWIDASRLEELPMSSLVEKVLRTAESASVGHRAPGLG